MLFGCSPAESKNNHWSDKRYLAFEWVSPPLSEAMNFDPQLPPRDVIKAILKTTRWAAKFILGDHTLRGEEGRNVCVCVKTS